MVALARSREATFPGVILFQTLAVLLGLMFYFVSPSYSLTVELVFQGPLKVLGP